MAPKEKIVNKLTNKLVLNEKPNSVDYHRTFRVLAITALHEIHFVEVIPNILKKSKPVELRLEKTIQSTGNNDTLKTVINIASHDVENNNSVISNLNENSSSTAVENLSSNNEVQSRTTKEKLEQSAKKKKSKSAHYQHQQRQQTQSNMNKKVEYDTQPFVLQTVKSIRKVKMPTKIVWYPNPSEMSVAFIQQGGSVMIIFNVLTINEEGKSIVQQRQAVNLEKEHVISFDVDDHNMHYANTNYNTNSSNISSIIVHTRNNICNTKTVKEHMSEKFTSNNSYLSSSTRSTLKDVKFDNKHRNVQCSSTPTTFTDNTFTSTTDNSGHVNNVDASVENKYDLDDNSICTSYSHKRASPKSLTQSVGIDEVNNEEKAKVPIELVNSSTGMSSAQMVKENVKKEVIININTKERTVEKIAWDLHNPYTLAVSSSTTWFELWSFEHDEYGERSKLLTLHPPPSHDQIKVSDLVFSPYNFNLIVVMAYVRNQYSVVIFDRRQLDQLKFIATPYKAITAAFHPEFTDLLAISYYKKSDSKQGQIAFLSITEKTKTAVNETKLNTRNEHNSKEQKTLCVCNVKQQEELQRKEKEEEEEIKQKCKNWSNIDLDKAKNVKHKVNQVDSNNDNNISSSEFLIVDNKCKSSNSNNQSKIDDDEHNNDNDNDNDNDDEESDCNDRWNFIIREDVLPPIDICEMISHLRWRPASHGEYVQLDTNYKYRTFISHLLEPTNCNTLEKKECYSELLSTQLWLGTLANFTYAITDSSTVTDVHIDVWDALNAQLPVASIKYLETTAKVPLDFVWINEITLVAILRSGPVIVTSLLNSTVNWKAKELFTPNKELITLLPNDKEKIKRNMSHDPCSTSHSSYSLSWPSPTESTKVQHDHCNTVTPSPNTSLNKLLQTNTRKQLEYDVDETVNLSSMHTILPTSAIDCGFFGNVYVIRNSAASLKTHYLSIVNKECNRFIAQLTSAINTEEQFPLKITSEPSREISMEEKMTQHVLPGMEKSKIQKIASDNVLQVIESNDNEITHVEPLTGATSSNAILSTSTSTTTTTTTTRRTTAVPSTNSNNNITTANTDAPTGENLWWTRMKHFVRSAIGNTSHKPRRPIRKAAIKNRNDSTSHSSTATAITRSVSDNADRNQCVSVHSLNLEVHLPIKTKYELQHATTTPTLLPPQPEHLHDDCESSVFVNTYSENNNALEDLAVTTHACRTESSYGEITNNDHHHHKYLSDNRKHCNYVVKGWPLIKIMRDMCNNDKKLDKVNIASNDYMKNDNNLYNVIECTEMQLHLPFVHPCLEIFSVDNNNNNNKCGWAYCESLHSSELFAMYALKWEMGYEVAEGLRHLDSIIDKVNKLREENNSLRCSIANQPSNNNNYYESLLEPHDENVLRRAPNITFIPDVYIVDDRFAAMMESNAEICDECNELLYKTHHHNSSSQQTPWWSSFDLTTLEWQESSVKEQTLDIDTAGHVCNTSLLSSNTYNNDSLESKNYNEGNYTDTRAHWWRVMAESLRTHNAHHVYEVTVSELEYASLIGDVQYCLVLYILYCLWWRIRHMEAVDLSITRYEEQNNYINTTHIRNDNINASDTFEKLNNAEECPLMPNQSGNSNQYRKNKCKEGEEEDGKKHDEYEQQLHATTTETRCTPDQWKMRALQWLETYSNALRQRKLFVPLNELLLIFPEISHEEKNAVQPKAPEIAYGKRATYIFCGNCNEEIEPELTVANSLEVPEVIKSFQRNLYERYYVDEQNNNKVMEELNPPSLELTEQHHYKRNKDTEHHKINVNKLISISENTDMYNSHHSYYNDAYNNTKHSPKQTIVSSSSSSSSPSSSLSEEETLRCREHECCYRNVNASLTETKNEHWHHNASCHHCNDATAMKCVICNEVVEGLYYWLCSCGHGGHPYHIQEWLEISNQCPRCGVVITDNTKSNRRQKKRTSSLSSSSSSLSSSSSSSSAFSALS